MIVLVPGGAGYIGAHLVRALAARGHQPVVLDDLRSSTAERCAGFPLERVSLEDTPAVLDVFARHRPEAVIHLAGSISVGESMRDPAKYWRNNLGGGASLLLAASRQPLRCFLFSSTAAVYGEVDEVPIKESAPLRPTSPYGASKLAFEKLLHRVAPTFGCRSVALRYFNASGAVPGWSVGEDHDPEEHLIPRILRAVRQRRPVELYGDDYPTPDGTCVRDYVHVGDLAEAHVLALESPSLPPAVSLNVGTGRGASVREVVATVGHSLGVEPRIRVLPRRPGDPARLIADPSELERLLGWRAEQGLDEIVASAASWEKIRAECSSSS